MVAETDGWNAKLQNPCQTSRHRQNPLPVCSFGLCSMEIVVPSVDPKPFLSINSLLSLWLESLTSTTPQGREHWMSWCSQVSGSSIASVTQEQTGLPLALGRNQIFLEDTCGDAYLSGWGEHKKPDSGIQFPWTMSLRHQLREKGTLLFRERLQAPTVTKGLRIQNC